MDKLGLRLELTWICYYITAGILICQYSATGSQECVVIVFLSSSNVGEFGRVVFHCR